MGKKSKKKEKKMAVKETRKLAKEDPSDIASEVLDDGYIDVMDDKTVALFPLGDMIIPTGIDYKPGDPEEDALAVTDALPEIEDLCFLEVPKVFSLKGSVVTPAMMLELSRAVQRVLIRPEVSGVVVTQPADNIEETAYFVSISLSDVFQNQNSKPIVFTTCMNPEDPMFDGTKNLLDSIRVACHDVKGDISTVVVCMNGEIHAASRAQLTHTNKASALASPGWGPVGYVDRDNVYFRCGALELDTGLNFPMLKKLTAKVPVVKAMCGDDGALLEMVLEKEPDAIIVEGFGRGNLPAGMMPAIKKAVKKGIFVVISTRASSGRVLDSTVFPGSVAQCLECGCLLAGETTTSKARLLLMYVLSQKEAIQLKKEDPERFFAYVQECLDPVLTNRLFG